MVIAVTYLSVRITFSCSSAGPRQRLATWNLTVPAVGWSASAGPVSNVSGSGRILEGMKPARAASRRYFPTSPFGPPPAAPPAEQFAVRDQVTHDTYGLGRVIGIEVDTALVVDFGSCRVRVMTPCAKLTKL
jgi:hypothetical protein